MVGVYTYWTDGRDAEKVNGGFNNTKDLALMLALSVEELKKQKHITEIRLVTNTFGKELLIDRYGLIFDKVMVELDHLDGVLDPNHWAYAKLYAYQLQEQPFIHLDNDVVIWEQLPADVLTAPLFFQNKESLETHGNYKRLLAKMKSASAADIGVLENPTDWALNCGVVGANDLNLVKEWFNRAHEFVFNPANKWWWSRQEDKHSFNHLFEQYFISSITAQRKMQEHVAVLIKDFSYSNTYKPSFKMTHLWGETKRNENYMLKIRSKLYHRYPKYKETLEPISPDHADVFRNIYRNNIWKEGSGGGSSIENTGEYRGMLQTVLTTMDITTVVDLGCGYWAFNDLMDWSGINYTGIDVVPAVISDNIEKHGSSERIFTVGDIKTCDIPPCDLLIIKDVFIHWKNQEVKDFFARYIPARYLLVTNDDRVEQENTDIVDTGFFRDIDITKPPFNIPAKVLLKWHKIRKSTHLVYGDQFGYDSDNIKGSTIPNNRPY